MYFQHSTRALQQSSALVPAIVAECVEAQKFVHSLEVASLGNPKSSMQGQILRLLLPVVIYNTWDTLWPAPAFLLHQQGLLGAGL